MEQVDQAYLDELLTSADDSKLDHKSKSKQEEVIKSHEEIGEMAKKMGRGDKEHDMTVIVHFIQVSSYFL